MTLCKPTLKNRLLVLAWRALPVALLTLSSVLGACSSTPFVWANDLPAERARPAMGREVIQPGDTIAVNVVGQAALSTQHTVAADGTISIPNLGPVGVARMTAADASKVLTRQFSNILASPDVAVAIVAQMIQVTVMGEVHSAGKYTIRSGDGVASALAMAGGTTEFGNKNAVYLIRTSEPLRIRFKLSDLLRGGDSATAFALRDGDLIVVE